VKYYVSSNTASLSTSTYRLVWFVSRR